MWTEGKSPSNLEAPVSEWVCIMMCVYMCVHNIKPQDF